jgi:hypothetical protein
MWLSYHDSDTPGPHDDDPAVRLTLRNLPDLNQTNLDRTARVGCRIPTH